jgi:hydroxymethylpyrimidine/phosphomethylpyrimidine kinase
VRPVVCSIGTTDPWNAAGLGLDLWALQECGVRAVSVVAAVSAQDAGGLHALGAISPELIAAQFAALDALPIAAYRVGALAGAAAVAAVAAAVRSRPAPLVLDPVLAPSGGGEFAGEATIAALLRELIPQAALVTPNLGEAERLTGLTVATVEEMTAAAARLAGPAAEAGAAGPAVLVKGGHLSGNPADVLWARGSSEAFAGERLPKTLRGTGCLLAAAAAAELAKGATIREAVVRARAFVRAKLESAARLGPMNVAY